jgi:hypothetical protein
MEILFSRWSAYVGAGSKMFKGINRMTGQSVTVSSHRHFFEAGAKRDSRQFFLCNSSRSLDCDA